MENIKRRATIRIPAKASLWYIASSAFARLIGALGTPVFTRLLTPEEYGLYPLYNTWLGVFTVIITLEMTGAVLYRGFQRYADDKERFADGVLGLILALFVGFGVLYALFHSLIDRLTGLNSAITSLMLLQIFANTVLSLYISRARFEYRYRSVVLLNLISSLTAPLMAITLIGTVGMRGEARIVASSLTLTAIALPVLFGLVKKVKSLASTDVWRYMLRRSLPLLPHYFSMTLILKVGELGISRIYGSAALGKYSVALSLGMALTVVTGGILSALSPWMLRRMKGGETERIRDLFLLLTELISVFCLGLLAVAPEVLALFSSGAYHSALPAVYPIALSVIPTFLSSALMSGGAYFERGGISALPSIVSASVSILLTLTLLPITDYRLVGLFVLISYTTLAALNVLVFTKMANEPPIYIKKTLAVFLLCCSYAALLFVFRDVITARLLLALPLALPFVRLCRSALTMIRE